MDGSTNDLQVQPHVMDILVSIETHTSAMSGSTKRIYPECSTSRTFADIANSNTLSESVCEYIEQLGYSITVKTPTWRE